jgi:hypothetical protein
MSSAAALVIDDDVPPAGTACEWCMHFGHWCPAKLYWRSDETESCICIPCAEGRDCSVVAAKLLSVVAALERFDTPVSPVRRVRPRDEFLKSVVPDTKPGSLMPYALDRGAVAPRKPALVRARYEPAPYPVEPVQQEQVPETPGKEVSAVRRILSDGEIRDIQVSSETETVNEIALRMGISSEAVRYHHLKARKDRAAGRQVPMAEVPRSTRSRVPAAAQVASPAPAPKPGPEVSGDSVTLPVTFTSGGMDAWWARLSLAEKASIVFASIVF